MTEIQKAKFDQKHLVRRMLELYAYDLSEYEDSDLNESGEFGHKYLDQYWTEKDRYPFIVRVDGHPAGFVFVNKFVYSDGIDHSIADFFVLKKYRRRGIGREVAIEILGRFPGSWEIRALKKNKRAIPFWNDVLTEFTNGNLDLFEGGVGEWTGPVWVIKKETIQNQSAHTTPASAPR